MTDYPAAHSMDTLWFGVDDDGHVAVFDTGEAGAVPGGLDPPEDPVDTSEALARKLPARPYRCDRHGTELAMRSMAIPEGEGLSAAGFGSGLFYLRAAPPVVQDAIDRGDLIAVPATDGVAVAPTGELAAELLAAIDTVLVAVDPYYDPDHADDDPVRQLSARGFYVYGMPFDNWICGPFTRETVPDTPLTVDEIPKRVRDTMTLHPLPGRLADLVLYHPAEHGPFETWEAAWLATDLKTVRPVPGEEDRYTEAYGDQDPDYGHQWLEPEGVTIRLEAGLRRLLDEEIDFLIVESRDNADHFVQFGAGRSLVIDCPTAALDAPHAERVAALYRSWGVTKPAVLGTGTDTFDVWQHDIGDNAHEAAALALVLMRKAFNAGPDALTITTGNS